MAGNYGEWFTISLTFTFKEADGTLGPDVVGNLFTLDRLPADTTASMDFFTLELASAKSFADPADPCRELIINGDAEDTDGNGHAYHPWFSPDSRYFHPLVLEEDDGSGGVNKFYRNQGRQWNWHQQRIYLNEECLGSGFVYTVSLKVRVASGSGFTYYVRLHGNRPDGSGHAPTVISCPRQEASDGWVECKADLLLKDDLTQLTNLYWDMRTGGESGTPAVIDFDDLKITYKSGVSVTCHTV